MIKGSKNMFFVQAVDLIKNFRKDLVFTFLLKITILLNIYLVGYF